MKEIADLITAIGAVIWPAAVVAVIVMFRVELRGLFSRNSEFGLKLPGAEFTVKPTAAERRPDEHAAVLSPVAGDQPIPGDYLFLNHTSFLRPEMQDEFQRRTGVFGVPHYDIRVQLDSYYEGALDRVEYVLYLLHEAYPEPIQARSRRADKFLLKEVANGEYVLLAKVYLKDRKDPLILQRYITLWKDGPRLTNTSATAP